MGKHRGWRRKGALPGSKGCAQMRFIFEVDMNTDALKLDPEGELGRAMRYWAGNLKNYPMEPGAGEEIFDSETQEAGSWAIVDD